MSILELEFRGPFTNEEELESAMDSLVITSQGPPGNSIEPSVVDENRLSQVEFVVRTLGFLAGKNGTEVICAPHTPVYDACEVTVDATEFLFRPAWLSRCIALADQTRVSTNLDGTIKIDMVFHSVVRKEAVV